MPISATGNPDALGFTLVELLVVLTILGLLSAAVVVAMPDTRGGLVAEAERFAARAKAAQDAAVIAARPAAVRVGPGGYGFDVRRDGAWQPQQVRPFADQAWSDGTAADVTAVTRIVFDPTGAAEPARVTIARGEERIAVDFAGNGSIHVVR